MSYVWPIRGRHTFRWGWNPANPGLSCEFGLFCADPSLPGLTTFSLDLGGLDTLTSDDKIWSNWGSPSSISVISPWRTFQASCFSCHYPGPHPTRLRYPYSIQLEEAELCRPPKNNITQMTLPCCQASSHLIQASSYQLRPLWEPRDLHHQW